MKAEESRVKMNTFNFEGMYKYNTSNNEYFNLEKRSDGTFFLGLELEESGKNSDPNGIIKMRTELDEKLKKRNQRCGIISNGNHGLDLLEIYNKNHEDDQIDFTEFDENTRVMFVYDSPANNLKDCFAYDKYYDTYNKDVDKVFSKVFQEAESKEYLCKHLWRSKDLDKDNCKDTNKIFSGSKYYGQMIASIMYKCKMKNAYTTNLVRYEITSDNKESFVSLRNMSKKDVVNPVFETIFLKEIQNFTPHIIVAVGKTVFDYLNASKRKKAIKEKIGEVEMSYVYHPASYNSMEEKKARFKQLENLLFEKKK